MLYDEVMESCSYVKSKVNRTPSVAMILGSGLGGVVDAMENKENISYAEIPGFPQSHIAGHSGQLVFGSLDGVEIVAMQGRFHYYEGFGMQKVTFPIYVLRALGAQKIIITNACGAINPSFVPGDLVLLTDYINLLGLNPLIGENDERFGPRFPDMTEAFSGSLRSLAEKTAKDNSLTLKHGVYAYFNGPCFETAAEIRAYAALGADMVGMSTVPETIVANYLGMEVLGLSCITNMATGLAKEKHSHEEVLRIANESSSRLCLLITEIAKKLRK